MTLSLDPSPCQERGNPLIRRNDIENHLAGIDWSHRTEGHRYHRPVTARRELAGDDQVLPLDSRRIPTQRARIERAVLVAQLERCGRTAKAIRISVVLRQRKAQYF